MSTPAHESQRMTLSRVVELMLSRGQHDRSSVTLSRNAKGDTQIEVVVRVGGGDTGIDTPQEAEQVATTIYDRLREAYPYGAGAGS